MRCLFFFFFCPRCRFALRCRRHLATKLGFDSPFFACTYIFAYVRLSHSRPPRREGKLLRLAPLGHNDPLGRHHQTRHSPSTRVARAAFPMMKRGRVGGPSSRPAGESAVTRSDVCHGDNSAARYPLRTDSGIGVGVTAASKRWRRADQALLRLLPPAPRRRVESRDPWFRVRSITLDVCGAASIWCISPLCGLSKSSVCVCARKCTCFRSHFSFIKPIH